MSLEGMCQFKKNTLSFKFNFQCSEDFDNEKNVKTKLGKLTCND